MSDEKKYIPKKGDIVWIDFDRFCCKVSKRSLVFQDDSYLSRDS